MSAVPTQLPQRTRILVKDILFQEKYNLTNTQLDIMSYIFNAISWARVERGYFVLTTKKICSDLPYISEKTLEASLRALKAQGLIEVEIVTVAKWNGAKVRGIKITAKGMEYNNSLYKPSQQDIVKKMQDEIDELNRIIREEKSPTIQEPTEPKPPKDEKVEEKKPKEEKPKKDKPKGLKQTFTQFVKEITGVFGTTGEPICNQVKGWHKETIFYINSYNKLSVITPLGDYRQLKNPREINRFWSWLYRNKDRVGVLYDFSKPLDVEELNHRFKGLKIEVNDIKLTVQEIIPAIGGVKIRVKSADKSIILSNPQKGEIIYSYSECEAILLKFRE